MSLSTFKEKILGQAAADVESFVRKHTDVVRRLHDDAIRDLRALEDGIVAAAVQEADVKAQSIHQQSELEGRSMVLAAKQAELIATKEAVLQVLTTLDESKKIELHTKLCALVADKRGTIVPLLSATNAQSLVCSSIFLLSSRVVSTCNTASLVAINSACFAASTIDRPSSSDC